MNNVYTNKLLFKLPILIPKFKRFKFSFYNYCFPPYNPPYNWPI